MILTLLTAFFVLSAGAAGVVCLALGLLSLSQYIESHAARARRIGLRLLFSVTLIHLLAVILDDLPLVPLLSTLAASALHYLAFSDPNWPFTSSPSTSSLVTSLLSLLLLPLTAHIGLVRHHTLTTHSWHQHRYDTLHRPKLPGGRLDWDVTVTAPKTREMTNLEVCAVLAECIWSVPVYRLVGRVAAAEWGSGGIDGRSGRGR